MDESWLVDLEDVLSKWRDVRSRSRSESINEIGKSEEQCTCHPGMVTNVWLCQMRTTVLRDRKRTFVQQEGVPTCRDSLCS